MLSNEFMKFLGATIEGEKAKTSKYTTNSVKSAPPLFYILLKTNTNKN